MLVIHENKGLNDWVRSVAGRFAGIGYSALAIDLLSAQGGTAKFADPAQATAELGKIPPEEFVANLKSGVGELQRRVPDKKIAAVGFCMGGGLSWRLLAAGEPQLAAAVPFYGPRPTIRTSPAPKTLRCLASTAPRTTASTPPKAAAEAALDKAGLVNELVIEPDANHAFFNDTGDRYNPTAAADAWRRVQDWFTKYLRYPREHGVRAHDSTCRGANTVARVSIHAVFLPVGVALLTAHAYQVLIQLMRVVQVANFYGPRSGGLRTAVDRLGAEYCAAGPRSLPGGTRRRGRVARAAVGGRANLPARAG